MFVFMLNLLTSLMFACLMCRSPPATHTCRARNQKKVCFMYVRVFLSRSVTLNCPGSLLSADKRPSYLIACGEDLINQLLLISPDKETKVNQSCTSKQGGVMAAWGGRTRMTDYTWVSFESLLFYCHLLLKNADFLREGEALKIGLKLSSGLSGVKSAWGGVARWLEHPSDKCRVSGCPWLLRVQRSNFTKIKVS